MEDFAAPSFQEGSRPVIYNIAMRWAAARAAARDRSTTGTHGLHLLNCVVNGEAVRLLDRREVLEGRRPFRRDHIEREDDVVAANEPLPIGIGCDVGEFIGIRAQVV